MRILLIALIVLVFILPANANAQHVLMMGWDGAGYRNIDLLLSQGRLPNIQQLLNNGGHYIKGSTYGQTATVRGWTTIFTGLDINQTSVGGNNRLVAIEPVTTDSYEFSTMAMQYVAYWAKTVPHEFTICSSIQSAGYKLGWFVSKPFLSDNPKLAPIYTCSLNADRYVIYFPHKEPYYLTKMYYDVKDFIETECQTSSCFIFVLTNPDHYGHIFGENSSEYLGEFEKSDTLLRYLYFLLDRPLVLVTSDHGFDESGIDHLNAPDVWVVSNMGLNTYYADCPSPCISLRDIGTTILDFLGEDIENRLPNKPQLRGKSLLK